MLILINKIYLFLIIINCSIKDTVLAQFFSMSIHFFNKKNHKNGNQIFNFVTIQKKSTITFLSLFYTPQVSNNIPEYPADYFLFHLQDIITKSLYSEKTYYLQMALSKTITNHGKEITRFR